MTMRRWMMATTVVVAMTATTTATAQASSEQLRLCVNSMEAQVTQAEAGQTLTGALLDLIGLLAEGPTDVVTRATVRAELAKWRAMHADNNTKIAQQRSMVSQIKRNLAH